jgi:hypothetical protein
VNLVEGLLKCIDSLKVDLDMIEKSKLFYIIEFYAQGKSRQPLVVPLAKRIMEKWNRMKYSIKSSYDSQGEFDEGYRQLHEKLGSIRKENDGSDEE